MKSLVDWLKRMMEESPGVPSTVRFIAVFGTVTITGTLLTVWAVACYHKGEMVEIPSSVGTTLGGFLVTILTSKVVQYYGEPNPPGTTPSTSLPILPTPVPFAVAPTPTPTPTPTATVDESIPHPAILS